VKRSSGSRPLGVSLIAIACFSGAIWSFAAAAFPSFFYRWSIPAYPPLLVLRHRVVEGAGRYVGFVLTGRGQDLGALLVGLALVILALLLWRRAHLAPFVFLSVLWIGTFYYALAFWRSNLRLLARTAFKQLSLGTSVIVVGNLIALLAVLLMVSAYLWRRRSLFG